MPLYEYSCKQCEHTFETLVMNGEQVECPECASAELEKLLSLPGRPKVQGSELPMQCNPKLPPCNPNCCRLQ
ncbi:MAG: zinc ribbon domain-containing protein [Gemmataceae bacterium]